MTELEKCLSAAAQFGWIIYARGVHIVFTKGTGRSGRAVVIRADDGTGKLTAATIGRKPVFRRRAETVLAELRR